MVIVLTSSELRHQYFAIQLIKGLGAKVIVETRESRPDRPGLTPLMKKHFSAFRETENAFFRQYVDLNIALLKANTLFEIPSGKINDPDVVQKISSYHPEVVSVFSTSLIKEELISKFERKMINLHAGLSPYYRGSGTNLFPFYNEELEYVGMTVHYINKGIDSGDILLQGRPLFVPCDNTHTIGCKNIILGASLVIQVIQAYLSAGGLDAVKQNLKQGKLYLKKDFKDSVIEQVQKNLKNGVVETYLDSPKEIDLVNVLKEPVFGCR